MFAIVEAGGRQEKVAPGALVIVDHLEVPAGAEVKFDKVLLAEAADGSFVAGSPYIKGASVTGVVEAQTKAKKIVASVDFYESDFGRLSVTPNRFMRARDALVLQTDMWAVAYLNGRRMVSIPLARTGDSERRQMLSEYTLVARNEKASGGVFDLTTS